MNKTPAAFAYGVLLAGLFMVLILGFDRSVGVAVFALLVGGHLLLTGWMPWKRLGMLLATVGMYCAGLALIALGLLGLLQHRDLVLLSPLLLVPLLVVLLGGPLLLWIDRNRHREAWNRWKQAVRGASLGDLLLGRHFPRQRPSSQALPRR